MGRSIGLQEIALWVFIGIQGYGYFNFEENRSLTALIFTLSLGQILIVFHTMDRRLKVLEKAMDEKETAAEEAADFPGPAKNETL